jgi:hypothetical protein
MFYGKTVEVLSAAEETGELAISESKSSFGQLILQVDQRDLISAWDASFHDQIDNYTTPLGFSTSASQEVWIEAAPSILVFQVQRVIFDTTSAQSVKVNSKFEFFEEIYADRFLYANKDKSTELR